MKNLPDKIYLQVDPEEELTDTDDFNELPLEAVTWADHRLNNSDVAYVRGEWIPVEDRLPENGQEILMYRNDAGVFPGFYGNLEENMADSFCESLRNHDGLTESEMWDVCFWSYSMLGPDRLEAEDLEPTHWMPLPEAPTA